MRGLLRILIGVVLCSNLNPARAETNLARQLPPVLVERPATTATIFDAFDAPLFSGIAQLAAVSPNLSVSEAGAGGFGEIYTVRGIGNTQFFSSPALALYVDDAPFGSVSTYSPALYAVERVEVWRGPQGDRFGRNGPAGVVRVTTQAPTDHWRVAGSGSTGNLESQRYLLSAAGPIWSNQLTVSAAGEFHQRDGFLHNTFRGTNPDDVAQVNGHASVRWTPSDQWDLQLTGFLNKGDDGTRLVSLAGNPYKTAADLDGTTDVDTNGQALRLAFHGDAVEAVAVTTHRYWQISPLTLDLDFTSFPGNTARINQDEEWWSQEIRLESKPDGDRWDWLAGVFYAHSERTGNDERNFFVPVPGFYVQQITDFEITGPNAALFGHVRWAATETLAITLGSRFDWTRQEMRRDKTTTFGPVPRITDAEDFYHVAPKLTVECRPFDGVLLYGSTGLDFKPGGFSAFIDPPASPAFDSEEIWASELGAKTTWFAGKLLANAAIFYNDITDYQVEKSIVGTTDLAIFNAPEARTYGAEVEVTARPVTGWELTGMIGYTQARFDQFTDKATGASLVGKTPPFVPAFNAAVAAQYTARCGAFARAEYRAVGRTYFDEANTAAFREDSYGVVNARVGYRHRYFAVEFFGENLSDSRYYSRKVPELNAGVPGLPLLIGVTVSARY